MKKQLLTTFLIIACYYVMNAQDKNNTSTTILSNISKDRPEDFMYLSAPDSTGYRRALKTPKKTDIQRRRRNEISELPYPIIFIHGLNFLVYYYCIHTDITLLSLRYTLPLE